MSETTRRRSLLAIIGPGMIVAATGVGAGDLATGAFTGSKLGVAILWAVVVGAALKFTVNEGLARFLETHADKGWSRLADFVGLRRDRVVSQSKIRRADEKDYRGGYEREGYSEPAPSAS